MQIRKLSVKRILSPVVFDNLKNPLPDGLYDAALGPTETHGRCNTCGLNGVQCPGHFGHVELPLPVYNPLIFGTLYKLLRHTCLHCFHFKLGRNEVRPAGEGGITRGGCWNRPTAVLTSRQA